MALVCRAVWGILRALLWINSAHLQDSEAHWYWGVGIQYGIAGVNMCFVASVYMKGKCVRM